MVLKLRAGLGLLALLSLILLSRCTYTTVNVNPNAPEDGAHVSLAITFDENSEFAVVARNAEAIGTADDMNPIKAQLAISKNKVSGMVKKIPVGRDRVVQVNVYDEHSKLCYVGKTMVDVGANEIVKAPVNLYKVDETGTIIIEGVIIDNNSSDYFTEEELIALVEKMSGAAGVDPKKVLEVLKKSLFTKKWRKSQLPEVEKIIALAIKEVNGGVNPGYFTVDELCTIVKEMAKKANKDIDNVFSILKKEGKLFEQKWKYEQKEEVMKIIAAAVEKAQDAGNNNGYFTIDELCTMVEDMAKKANKDVDDVFSILKREGKLFEQKWKYEQKEEVMKIIAAAVEKAQEANPNPEYFTLDELNALVKEMSLKANVDPEKVMTVLKKSGKFYETKWKKSQKREVIALIEAAIKEVNGNPNPNPKYFTLDELNALVKEMSAKANVDPEKVMAVLKKGEKFYETKWKKSQKREVMALVEEAIKEIS